MSFHSIFWLECSLLFNLIVYIAHVLSFYFFDLSAYYCLILLYTLHMSYIDLSAWYHSLNCILCTCPFILFFWLECLLLFNLLVYIAHVLFWPECWNWFTNLYIAHVLFWPECLCFVWMNIKYCQYHSDICLNPTHLGMFIFLIFCE